MKRMMFYFSERPVEMSVEYVLNKCKTTLISSQELMIMTPDGGLFASNDVTLLELWRVRSSIEIKNNDLKCKAYFAETPAIQY